MSSDFVSYPHTETEQQIHDSHLIPKLCAEFIGTFFLVFSVATCEGILAPLAIGFTLMAMVFLGGHVSGGHYNPAVTLGVWLRKKITLGECLYYILIQFIASLVSAGIAFGVTGNHGGPQPGDGYTSGHAFIVEVIWTFALVSVVLNVATTKSQEDNSFFGLAIGSVIFIGGVAVGAISGGCFNPAVFFGLSVVDNANGGDSLKYIWIYWVAPPLGSIIAVLTFRVMNGREFKSPIGTRNPPALVSPESFAPLLPTSSSSNKAPYIV